MKRKYTIIGLIAIMSVLSTTYIAAADEGGLNDGNFYPLKVLGSQQKVKWILDMSTASNTASEVDLSSLTEIHYTLINKDTTEIDGTVKITNARVSGNLIYMTVRASEIPKYDPDAIEDTIAHIHYKVGIDDYSATGPGFRWRRS